MKTIIAGSRHIVDADTVFNYIDSSFIDITEVVCGGARGVDTLGRQWAENNDIAVTVFNADWDRYGVMAAGMIRNGVMADYGDALILIWDGKSRGSADMLRRARRNRLRIEEFVVGNIQLV